MEKEIPVGKLLGDKIITDEKSFFDKGRFGAVIENRLEMALYEALFLLERNKLTITDYRNKEIDFDGFVSKAEKIDKKFWIKYCVYRDIRKRGYITKTALKYGADFRVYDRGALPGQEHAKYVLYCVGEDETFDWKKFVAMARVAHSVRKKLLIGIADAEGDVTYYITNWKRP